MSQEYFQSEGAIIRPNVPDAEIPKLVKRLYGMEVVRWKELNSYDDRNYHVTVKNCYDNAHITEVNRDGYVLKVLNSMQSKIPTLVEAQAAALKHLKGKTVTVPELVPTVDGKDWSTEKIYPPSLNDGANETESGPCEVYIIRLLTYIPGKLAFDCPYVPQMLYNIGKLVGGFLKAMESFYHPFYENYTYLWNLPEASKLSEFVYTVQDKLHYDIVMEVIESFQTKVIPSFNLLQKGYVHGDLNEQNILMKVAPGQDDIAPEKRVYEVCGLLDFSDITKSYPVCDIAIAIAYFSIEAKLIHQLDAGGHILAGCLTQYQISEIEMDILRILICCRLCQSLVLGAYNFKMDPTNEYVVTTAEKGWPLLMLYWKTPNEKLLSRWKNIIESYNEQ